MQQDHLEKTISAIDMPCVLVYAVSTWLSWKLQFSESVSLNGLVFASAKRGVCLLN